MEDLRDDQLMMWHVFSSIVRPKDAIGNIWRPRFRNIFSDPAMKYATVHFGYCSGTRGDVKTYFPLAFSIVIDIIKIYQNVYHACISYRLTNIT